MANSLDKLTKNLFEKTFNYSVKEQEKNEKKVNKNNKKKKVSMDSNEETSEYIKHNIVKIAQKKKIKL
jgi:hypothetical protein